MGTWDLHHNEEYFPDSTKFDPDGWSTIQKSQRLEKGFVAFGKGSRMCVGMKYCKLTQCFLNKGARADDSQVLNIASSTLSLESSLDALAIWRAII
jgi:Cytochrome P450